MWLCIIDIIDPHALFRDVWFWFNGTTPSLYMILNTRLWMLQHLVSMVVCEIAYLGVLSSEGFWTSKMNRTVAVSRWTQDCCLSETPVWPGHGSSYINPAEAKKKSQPRLGKVQLYVQHSECLRSWGPMISWCPIFCFTGEFKSLRFFKVPCCEPWQSQAYEHVWVHSVEQLTESIRGK